MWQQIINFLLNHTPLLYWTQSLWRDEAFSVWISQDSLSEVIRRTSGDFNPPLYYILLHYWMGLFGRSEIALRGLSVASFVLFLLVVNKFAQKIFKSKHEARLTTLLMAINPMLLYFAFELRMYALLTLFVTLSMYFLFTENWFWYVITTILGLYTQPFMAFIIITQSLYLLLTKKIVRFFKNSFFIGLLYLPWIPTLINQFRHSGPMWMYPVNTTLMFAVLGNLYAGYEGTPGNFWLPMQIISVCILAIGCVAWRKKNLRPAILLMSLLVGIPTVLVLLISMVKPIYVHRYLIYVTVGEVFLISLGLQTIKNAKYKQWLWTGIILLTSIGSLIVAPVFHQKVNLQKTFVQMRPLIKPTDVIYAETPLVYYESLYYAPNDTQVFLYNPQKIMPPRYVGNVGMPESIWATEFPVYPIRAFIIQENGEFKITSLLEKK